MSSYCLVADTPFQLLNIINFRLNTIKNESADLFINESGVMQKFANRVIIAEIFENVYTYKRRSKSKKIIYYLYDLKQAALPRYFIDELTSNKFKFNEKDYKFITVTSGHDVEMALVRCFPKAIHIAIDDGLGSYFGDIIHNHKLSFVWKIFGRNMKKIKPICLYVNNAGICESTMCDDVSDLSSLRTSSDDFKSIIRNIFFDECENLYAKYPIIFLTQPLSEIKKSDKCIQLYEEIIKLTKNKLGKNIIIRIHPRDNQDPQIYGNIPIDLSSSLWELICANHIESNYILMSVCSSSQIMPKIIYNNEPNIIFLYQIFKEYIKDDVYIRFNNIFNLIKNYYLNKEKIYLPNNIEEFVSIMEKFN
ncbi:MAG: hypothetical protein IJ583_07305 [Firmicutes bacterium]|nr:hypothetical protein [Bacillota bacterium]